MSTIQALYAYVPLVWVVTAVILAASGEWFSSFLALQLAFVTFVTQPVGWGA